MISSLLYAKQEVTLTLCIVLVTFMFLTALVIYRLMERIGVHPDSLGEEGFITKVACFHRSNGIMLVY